MGDPQVKELEKRVAELIAERDELYRDIETLCMQSDDSFWSGSAVLSARIGNAERALSAMAAENDRLTAQRDSLREDLAQFRSAKRDSDKISKDEMEKNRVLDRELMFYKKQCERALEDRNLFSYEVEELKRANLELERGLAEARGLAETEAAQRADVAGRLAAAEGRVATLEERLVEVVRIPELEAQLEASRRDGQRQAEAISAMEAELGAARRDLDAAREDAEAVREDREALARELEASREEAKAALGAQAAKAADMERQIESLTTQLESVSTELQEADSAVAAAQAQVELINGEREQEVCHLREEYSSTIQDLEGRISTTESLLNRQAEELQDVTQAKVDALVRLSEWQAKATHNEHRLGELESRLATVDIRDPDTKGVTPSTKKAAGGQEDTGPKSWFNWQQGKQAAGANMPRNVETHV
ncbi:unnamed protein product [Ostreobium quekettii]|uniref:Uncharacterized protein n=1 Tax=Ostreobium quekettii TaxID=121088 RepID=A0A8S1IMY6_9CHLO|nr:unnamed protein product [Ostreobium quekettii]|eukprot:evm.model.scf_73.8 EVM.evm.TU.scf_73.8   scf_73:49663-52942(+)